jgi:hypothetical protein
LGPYVRTLVWPFTFSPWSPTSHPAGQEPTTTFQHRVVEMAFRPCQIHTPSYPLFARVRSFRASSLAYHPDPLVADRLLSTSTVPVRLVAALGLLTSDLYHLAVVLPAHRVLAASAECAKHLLPRPSVGLLSIQPLGDRTPTCPAWVSLSALVVVRASPSTLPYHLS